MRPKTAGQEVNRWIKEGRKNYMIQQEEEREKKMQELTFTKEEKKRERDRNNSKCKETVENLNLDRSKDRAIDG